MDQDSIGVLDNKTIAKLAFAIATAIRQQDEGTGPLVGKVLAKLDVIDSLDHFVSYRPSAAR